MTNAKNSQPNYTTTFIVLPVMFLIWGLITVLNGFLVQHLMNAFVLNYKDSVIMAMAFFGSYLLVSLPAGKLIDSSGFKNGIMIGLILASLGCLLFYLAAIRISYALSLLSFFLLGSGITILQVGANPYVVLLGRRGKGAQRLTFVQAFNAMGTVLATVYAESILKVDESLDPASIKAAFAREVQVPYLLMAVVLMLVALVIGYIKLPKVITRRVDPLVKEGIFPRRHVLEFHHVALGCLAIFVYVGAEVTIFRFLLSKMAMAMDEHVSKEIDQMIKLYWGGLMAGRFIGAAVLSRISPRKLITICSLAAALLVVIFIFIAPSGPPQVWTTALWVLTATGLFNSILFPCIFTMGIDGLGKFSEEASSMLIMSIAGGAVIPVFVFELISVSIPAAFAIIVAAYLFIAFFGIRGSRYEKGTSA